VQRFRKELERYVTVVPTNEMRTSRVCSHGCGWEEEEEEAWEQPVRAMSEEEQEERKRKFDLIPVRGERSVSGRAGPCLHAVRYCKGCRTIWNRDVNAARNIAYSFWWQRGHAGELPPRFRRRRRDEDGGSGGGEPQTVVGAVLSRGADPPESRKPLPQKATQVASGGGGQH
jgi:hypothetical protein